MKSVQLKKSSVSALVHRTGRKMIELPGTVPAERNKLALRKLLLPPANIFNTGYLKGRDNDPL